MSDTSTVDERRLRHPKCALSHDPVDADLARRGTWRLTERIGKGVLLFTFWQRHPGGTYEHATTLMASIPEVLFWAGKVAAR